MLRFVLYLLTAFALVSPVLADDTNRTPAVEFLFGTETGNVNIANGTPRLVQKGIGKADDFGLRVAIPVGTPNLKLDFRYAMRPEDTHVAPSSSDGTEFTTSITFSAAITLLNLKPPPCGSMEVTATNQDAAPISATVQLFRY